MAEADLPSATEGFVHSLKAEVGPGTHVLLAVVRPRDLTQFWIDIRVVFRGRVNGNAVKGEGPF